MNTFSNLARQRCSALATYSHASTRPNAQSSTSRRVPGRRSGNLIAPHQFAGPMSRPHRQVATHIWPFDQAWDPSLDVESISKVLPQNLFAISLFPYIGFLYHLTKSKQAPPLTLFGFYFLLVFVFATIPAGIYAKNVYGTSLANVDYLHGTAEFLLTLTNLFIVLGLRKAIKEAENKAAANGTVGEISKTSTAEGGIPRK